MGAIEDVSVHICHDVKTIGSLRNKPEYSDLVHLEKSSVFSESYSTTFQKDRQSCDTLLHQGPLRNTCPGCTLNPPFVHYGGEGVYPGKATDLRCDGSIMPRVRQIDVLSLCMSLRLFAPETM